MIMNYDALKDQWSEVEDHDGIRLSWNTFPSSRMVRLSLAKTALADDAPGGFPACRTHRRVVHSPEREA